MIKYINQKGVIFIKHYDENIVPKYRKRKRKKTPKKTNHKHDYKKLLIRTVINGKERYHSGERCTICKKIGNEKLLEARRLEGTRWYTVLSQEEVLEKYKEYEVVDK